MQGGAIISPALPLERLCSVDCSVDTTIVALKWPTCDSGIAVMFFQVLIETSEKVGRSQKNKEHFELDKTDLTEIENRVVKPFLLNEQFQFDGYFLRKSEIKRLIIKETQQTVQELSRYENEHMPPGIIMYISPSDIVSYEQYTKDITTQVFDSVKSSISGVGGAVKKSVVANDASKVFIVHGRDEAAKTETARFIEKLGLSAIILHEQASSGKTIIEKIEEHTNVGYGIVLYTPCDVGGLLDDSSQKPRARQNVIFEHGFLIGKLGRQNVCALVKDQVEIPNDISGIVFIPLDSLGACRMALGKELRKAGYNIDMNKIV